jgi:hypothetical protein
LNAPEKEKNRCTKRPACNAEDQSADDACVPRALTDAYKAIPDKMFTYASGNQPDMLKCDGKKIDFGSDTTGGRNTPCAAAMYSDNVLCIGNVWDAKHDFENQGDYSTTMVAFGAPGKNILSTCPPSDGPKGSYLQNGDLPYCYASGTSMSTPMVAGLSGMLMKLFQLKGKDDLMNGKNIADTLLTSVVPVDSLAKKFEKGGYVNAQTAFDKAMKQSTSSSKVADDSGASIKALAKSSEIDTGSQQQFLFSAADVDTDELGMALYF